ncbi:kinase-like domain-containing protein [Dichomitus squalens]|uniref:Kinase-like domain-containing protein n=1 Tax=Dichomitus squalens TaxID=114155 RepID=A0A4Q9Q4T4_9APHY|nr:kinase-like domain-containing protein [Dichomitus squalens]
MFTSSYTLVEAPAPSPGTPSHSPPPSRDGPQKVQVSPANSDDSSIACDLSDLSFNYERNSRGEIVRVSKGSSKASSTPPTPSDSPPKAPSPVLGGPAATYSRPPPLARSESLPQESLYQPRQFQRATSGPLAITPAGTSRGFSALAATNAATGRKLGGARRVRLEDLPEGDVQPKPNTQPAAPFPSAATAFDEKENQRARAIRPARSIGKSLGFERIPEVPSGEEQHAPQPIRPRRSASLSDAPPPIDPLPERPIAGHARPGTGLGARRVTLEEKLRQEREIALEEGYARREAEEAAARAAQAQGAGQGYVPAPSPTHVARPHLRHERKDSDTMRGGSGSPTAVDPPRHRRSPTALDAQAHKQGHWEEGELQQPPIQATKSAPVPLTAAPSQSGERGGSSRTIIVNKKGYQRLDLLGKGGSSRVFRVMTGSHEIFALKRVALDKVDADTMSGYMNEIALLKRLEGNQRIIRLLDSEVKQGGGSSKGALFLVMECGEIDLAKLLQEQQKEPMDPVWVAYYWKQMLQAVHVIHEEKIVHSDLKPANFVLVKGQLKLIDFGIANAIANDTTNIQRDHQIGTVNYMSPEAIELPEGMRRLKVGRPSDVWSLGCILYQMVYGQPPFQNFNVYQKMKVIPDESHVIEFPEYAVPVAQRRKEGATTTTGSPPQKLEHLRVRVPQSIINTMKSCLVRNPKARATIPELLQQNWLEPEPSRAPSPSPPPPQYPELQLREDETIINPHYMRQLLEYGLRRGADGIDGWTEERLAAEAERLVSELKHINRDAALSAAASRQMS